MSSTRCLYNQDGNGKDYNSKAKTNWFKMLVLLPLLGGGAAGADERHDDDHDRGDGAHGDHDDDQEVAVLLGRGAAVRWTHLTNWGL